MPIHPPQQRQWTIDQYPVNASDHWSSVGEVEKGQTLIRGNQGGLHILLFFFLCLLFLLLFSHLILVCFTSIAPVSSFLSSFLSLAHPFDDLSPIFFSSLSLFSSFSSSFSSPPPWHQTPLLKGNREEFNKHQRSMAIQPNQSSFIITSYIQFNEQNSTNIQCCWFLKAFKKMPRMGTCQELRLDFIASPVLITLTVQQHTAAVLLLLQIP